MVSDDFPIVSFKDPQEWEEWLEKHHDQTNGAWMQFYKKNSGVQSINYQQTLDVALCYGWIDSQAKKYDEISYLQKFTPRRSKSIWSKINRERVQQLIKDGRMKPAGLLQIELAKQDGRWEAAYDSPANITLPKEFVQALQKNKKAMEFYQTLTKANTYAIAWRLQTAKKPETKERRMKQIIEMLERKEKFH